MKKEHVLSLLGEFCIRPKMVKYNAIFIMVTVLSIVRLHEAGVESGYRHYARGGIRHGRGKTIAKIHG